MWKMTRRLSENTKGNYSVRSTWNYIWRKTDFTRSELLFCIWEKICDHGGKWLWEIFVVKAVVGLHEQYSGNILFDGVNKEVYNKDSIFRQIAYIGQDVYIFNDTIRFNLTLGRTVDADEMINVLKKVNLDVFINGQEKQLDTVLGDNGKNISGGQKQRIAIARSLLQQKKIFIVDEGTSALDEKNAEMIEKLF